MSESVQYELLGVVAGLALLLGIVALVRVDQMRSEIQRLEALTSDVSHLQASLISAEEWITELQDSQRWISNLEWSIDPDRVPPECAGDLPVIATWTFQELDRDADVAVEFRSNRDSRWERYAAEPESDVDYSVTALLDPSRNWQYRIVSESDLGVRVSEEREFAEFGDLVRRDPVVEIGESVSDEGVSWNRYVVNNRSNLLSPCNQIVSAEIQVFEGDSHVETFNMLQKYPGEHLPEGVNIEMRSGAGADDGEAAEDRAVPFFQGAQRNWWSDWIRRDENQEIVASVEFADGTEMRVDARGTH